MYRDRRRGVSAFALCAVIALWPPPVNSDDLGRLIRQLHTNPHYKRRLAAGLRLARTGGTRAVPAFIKALADTNKTVRGVAAASLAKLVNDNVSLSVRTRTLTSLQKLRNRDPNRFVRRQADKAYLSISSRMAKRRATEIYVDVGVMSDNSGAAHDSAGWLRTTVIRAVKAHAPNLRLRAGPQSPGSVHIDGTLLSAQVRRNGSIYELTCKVNLVLASYPQKKMFGFLEGTGKVQTGKHDTAHATRDCVAAVIDDLVKTKMVPAVRNRAGQ